MMPVYSLLNELDRKIIMFIYEQYNDQQDENKEVSFTEMLKNILSEDYRAFVLTKGTYILWELKKRKLLEAEIISHAWLVTSLTNQAFIFHFQNHNRLIIDCLLNDGKCVGYWALEHGILSVIFEYDQHHYDINIIGNNNALLHSALQIVDNDKAYLLKVAPISHAKYGQALLD